LPAVAAELLRAPIADSYVAFASWTPRLPFGVRALPYAVPAAVLAGSVVAIVVRRPIRPAAALQSADPSQAGSEPGPIGSEAPGVAGWAIATLLVLAVVGAPALLVHRQSVKASLEIDVHAQYGQWEEVLESAECLGVEDFTSISMLDVNRALFHTGVLLDTMFEYPQSTVTLLQQYVDVQAGPSSAAVAYAKVGELMMDLGRLNEAEVLHAEAWEIFGDRPELLARLAAINAAKGRTDAARAFAEALDASPVRRGLIGRVLGGRRWVAHLPSAEEAAEARARWVEADTCLRYENNDFLRQLLEANPDNRMAYEYLLAQHMLSGEVEPVARGLAHLSSFGYPAIPRHCEEALLLAADISGQQPMIPGYSVSSESLRRFAEFRRVRAEYGANLAAARSVMAERFAGSYLLYYTFPDVGGGMR
jgi:hypothetical protein